LGDRRASGRRRAARAVTHLYSREMKKTGLEPAQFGLLLALSSGGEMTQGYMAEHLAKRLRGRPGIDVVLRHVELEKMGR